MPIAYSVNEKGAFTTSRADVFNPTPDVVWIDAVSPNDNELNQLDKLMGFEIPNRHDMAEIELSSRLYREDNGALVMVANLLPKETRGIALPRPAAFILRENLLLTIRYSEFYSFERVSNRLPAPGESHTPVAVFCRLLEEAVADRADNIELSMRNMETLTSWLFAEPGPKTRAVSETPELEAALRQIGSMGEAISSIRESITSLQRAANFAYTYVPAPWMGDQRIVLESIKTDLTALTDEASFFIDKLQFNLDATLGMINVDESKIIRFLSAVTLLLSPPTLIAGIYGMNFEIMPELKWPLGYLFSVGLMLASTAASIWYLRRKRWM
jgi:magnesium transporter